MVAVVEAWVLRRVRHAPHTESVHHREASPRLAQTEASKERIEWGLDRLGTPEEGVMRWSLRASPAGGREESAVGLELLRHRAEVCWGLEYGIVS